jgi:acetylornithine/N-succinyldiaminopimelate aminotransferase
MNTQEVIDLYTKYVIPNYTRAPVLMTKGKGAKLWDDTGKEYLDLFAGWAVCTLGHCAQPVVQAMKKQLNELMFVPNIFYTQNQGRLAQLISEHSFKGQCFFANSGAEANEGAIKLARLYAGGKRYKVIAFENSFHGRTLATLSATGQMKYHAGFDPLVTWFRHAKLNDLDSVKALIDDDTMAILVEPIQGEGGVVPCHEGFLPALRELCDKHKMCLICDEVWTGVGRTGKWFGYQHFGIEPDIMTLAKGLGGGAVIGCFTAKPHIAAALKPGTHASTFGGSPLACSAAIAVFETIEQKNLIENSAKMGEFAMKRLKKMQKARPVIKDVRGRGLMIGIELNVPGGPVVTKAREAGLLINCAHESVIRLAPPLNVRRSELDQGLKVFDQVLAGM